MGQGPGGLFDMIALAIGAFVWWIKVLTGTILKSPICRMLFRPKSVFTWLRGWEGSARDAPNRQTHAPCLRHGWAAPAMAPDKVNDSGRDDVSEPASISVGIAGRYAQALFELAKDEGALKALEADAEALQAALAASPELAEMIASPVVARAEQTDAMVAVAAKMGLSTLTTNTLALMGANRRLFVVSQLVADLQARIAVEKGEVTADVTSATKLSAAQAKKLAETLKAKVGKTVKLNTTVDETLIGGLIVKLGSTMIDTSVKAKLAALQNAMKEVG